MKNTETINIVETNLVTYSLKLQTAFRDGYRLSEKYLPSEIGFTYSAWLEKEVDVVEKQQTVGRPKKNT